MSKPPQESAELERTGGQQARLLAVSVQLAELIAKELPDHARAKELSDELMRSALQCMAAEPPEPPNLRTISLSQACQDVCAAVSASLPPAITLQIEVSPDPQTPLIQESVILALLSALLNEATSELRGSGQVAFSAKAGEDSWVIEVRSQASQNELSQVDKERLQDCRRIAESLGGHLILWSEPGRRVRLVNLPFQPAQTIKTEPPKDAKTSRTAPRQVLLVDDEESIRLVGRAALEKAGHRVLLAKDGKEALELFKKHRQEIDIILLDLVMPNLSGSQCFEQLKNLDPNIKVVIMSGFTPNTLVNNLIADGCLDFLRKPFDLVELLETLNKALGIAKT